MPETAEPITIQEPFFTPEGKPVGTRLSDLVVPEKYRQEIEDDLRSRRYRGTKRDWLWVVNYPKLCMYYAGEDVLYYDEGDDWVVLAHGASDDARLRFILRNGRRYAV